MRMPTYVLFFHQTSYPCGAHSVFKFRAESLEVAEAQVREFLAESKYIGEGYYRLVDSRDWYKTLARFKKAGAA